MAPKPSPKRRRNVNAARSAPGRYARDKARKPRQRLKRSAAAFLTGWAIALTPPGGKAILPLTKTVAAEERKAPPAGTQRQKKESVRYFTEKLDRMIGTRETIRRYSADQKRKIAKEMIRRREALRPNREEYVRVLLNTYAVNRQVSLMHLSKNWAAFLDHPTYQKTVKQVNEYWDLREQYTREYPELSDDFQLFFLRSTGKATLLARHHAQDLGDLGLEHQLKLTSNLWGIIIRDSKVWYSFFKKRMRSQSM